MAGWSGFLFLFQLLYLWSLYFNGPYFFWLSIFSDFLLFPISFFLVFLLFLIFYFFGFPTFPDFVLFFLPISDSFQFPTFFNFLLFMISFFWFPTFFYFLFFFDFLLFYYTPRPAERSDAGRGSFYFPPHSDLHQVTTVSLFKVTMFTVHISSIGSHFLTARILVYWTYKVSKLGYGGTKWIVTMYSKYP